MAFAAAEKLSDKRLMEAFCQGDAEAFEVLFSRYAKSVQGFLLQMVRDLGDAEDLLQVTFLAFVRERGRYDPTYRVKGWIYAIARNAARDFLRRRRARRELRTEDGENPTEESLETPPNLIREQWIAGALAKIPDPQREAVVLHHFEDLSFQEIAQILGTSVNAVKIRAHRGYRALHHILTESEAG